MAVLLLSNRFVIMSNFASILARSNFKVCTDMFSSIVGESELTRLSSISDIVLSYTIVNNLFLLGTTLYVRMIINETFKP